jgi:Glycosyl hydrolase family 12/Cellulose binding domain
MIRSRPALFSAAAVLVGVGCVLAALDASPHTPALRLAAATTLCQEQTASVSGGTYIVQNNEFDSGASECATTDGSDDFTIANSSISNSTSGSPGAYPAIYQGCHWGNCSSGGLSAKPVQVSSLTPGAVTTSWSTTQPGGSSAYDVAYDIWFNQTPTTSGQPNGTELMVWLNHNGSVQPLGSEVASNVSLGGHTYNIWEGAQSSWDTVTYEMTSPATSVTGLDVGTLTQDMVTRGYTKSSWYLIDVEAGFELWQGGAGLETNSFSVNIGGSSPTPPSSSPSAPAPTPTGAAPSTSPSPTSPGTSACSAAYSVVSGWAGGFQGQVVVTNTGPAPLHGWQLGWTFPGNQAVNNLWNGSDTQSGGQVTVTNASYNGTLAPGASTTVGFTATYSGSNTAPASVTCT